MVYGISVYVVNRSKANIPAYIRYVLVPFSKGRKLCYNTHNGVELEI